MATKKTTKKKSAARKDKPQIQAKKPIRREVLDSVLSVIAFAVTLLLVLSVYKNVLGPFGTVLYTVLHSLFGYTAWLLPLFTLWLGVNLMRPEHHVSTRVKLVTGLVLTVSISGLCYLFEANEFFESYTFLTFFSKALPEMAARAGGILGGFFAFPLICLATKIGFAIITVALLIISSLTFFDVTLLQAWLKIKSLFESDQEQTDEPPAIKPEIVKKDRRRKTIDVFVDDEPTEAPAYEPEIVVDGDEVEIKPFSSIPFFVHDDVNPDEYITSADALPFEISTEALNPKKRTRSSKKEKEGVYEGVQQEMYMFPPKSLLETPKVTGGISRTEIMQTEQKLIQTLSDFGIDATTVGASVGPIVTRYEISPSKGVRVSKITSLADDIALSLAATSIRIEAPIPGKAAVGIEVPNKNKSTVFIKELLDSDDFSKAKSSLTVALGKDISGNLVFGDLADMPHLLVAGATGSGKSVCINSILISLLYKASPEDVKLILIDPKVVELEVYNKIPHLIVPVVSNPKKAAGALQWAVNEMEKRYNMFTVFGVRNIHGYNEHVKKHPGDCQKMPQIVIVIDELADLMMACAKEVEDYIVRLCQKARAAGIYLIIATQRPSVNVVTGLIKANVPSRIAFAVTSQIDSRVILDASGAEKLLGKGDMLFKGRTMGTPLRIQCCFVSDSEVEAVTSHIVKYSGAATYDQTANEAMESYSSQDGGSKASGNSEDSELDDMFWDAVKYVIETGKASTSNLQRKFSLGYARAARIVDQMEEKNIIGPYEGAKPRQVLMTLAEYNEMMVKRDD